MSILDAFYILFQSKGTDQVKKDEENLKKSGDDLNKSMQDSSSLADKMGNSFGSLGNQLFSTLTAAASLGAVLHGIKESISYAQQVDLASRQLAVNVDELDAWDNAVRRTGGTAEQFQGSLRNLAQQLGTSGQVALQILPQLADSFQQMGRFAAIRYGEMLGLDENTILLLQKGRREVEALIKQQKLLGVVSKQDAEQARAFNYAWQDTTHSLRIAFMELGEAALPAIIEIVQVFGQAAQYLQKHSDLIAGALIAIGTAAIYMNKSFFGTASLISLLISAFSLLYEDLKYFSEGYDSFTGRLLAKFPALQKELSAFIRLFKDLKSASEWLYQTGNKIDSKWENLFNKNTNNDSSLENNNGFSLSAEDIKRLQNSKLNHVKKVLDIATTSAVSYTKPSDLQRYAIPSQKKSVSINTGPITINTQATDGQGTARAFGNYLNDQIIQANNYFDDGVQS